MARGQIVVDGATWEVYPTGRVTVYGRDQFGIVFQQGTGPDRRRRFTRFAPVDRMVRSRTITDPTNLRGHVDREATTCAMFMKY
jgi:hypothetical protein